MWSSRCSPGSSAAKGRVYRKNLAHDDSPKIASQDNHDFLIQLVGNAIFGFFAVGALAIVGVVAASIAGVALATVGVAAAVVMGATAIGAVVVTAQDAIAGEARSLGDATLDLIGWGLRGLAFFVGGTAFMGLKSIVSTAPYIGQLTSQQIIATMLGNAIMGSSVAGIANLFVQMLELPFKDSSDDDKGINWDEVNAAAHAGPLPGMMEGTGLNLAG